MRFAYKKKKVIPSKKMIQVNMSTRSIKLLFSERKIIELIYT